MNTKPHSGMASKLAAALWLTALSATPAQTAVQAWVQRYSHPADASDYAQKVVTDNAGNVIVAGYTDNGINGADFLIIKYSGAGVPLWTNRYNGPGNYDDVATAVAVDGRGNAFVTGYSAGSGSDFDYATIKYSAAGVPLWTNRYNGPANGGDYAQAVTVDASGDVFVTGTSVGSGSSLDYATIKYSGAGVPLWTNFYNGPGNDRNYASAVAVDGSGNVLVTGFSYGSGGVNPDYATIKYSGAGVPLWTNFYNGPGNSDDVAQAVAVDGSGNVFVTGSSYDTNGYPDYATIKYSGAGVPLWTNLYNGPGNGYDAALAVAVDGSGNVFVTGYSDGSGGYSDYATIKYSGAGVPLWTNRYNGPGNRDDVAQAVAVDGSGNVFVTGSSYDTNGYPDYATIKYSGAGVPLWTNLYNGPGNGDDQAYGLAVGGTGNVFVTGTSGTYPNRDYATVAYSGAGAPLWTNLYNGPGNSDDQDQGLVVDGGGNVVVTGRSVGGGGTYDYATIKYSEAGVPLWTNRYHGPGNNDDGATAVAVDGSGNVLVTGYSVNSGGTYDYATIKYSGAGAPLWTNRYNGPPGDETDLATAMAVDGFGNVLVTGSSYDSGGASVAYATIKYSAAGAPLWTNRYNGPGNGYDAARAVAVDGSGNVVVTGSSYGSGGDSDYATIKYSEAGAPLWTNRYNGPGNGYDVATAVAVDGGGNVVVTGYSVGSSGLNWDYATIAYSGAGVPLWTNRYNGPANGNDEPQTRSCLAIGLDGAVYVTGASDGNYTYSTSYDYATIKYVIVPPNHAPLAAIIASPLFALSPSETNLFILSPKNAVAALVFDGSQSSDADNDPMQFSWYADGQPNALAAGPVATILFAAGPHTVTLVVSDGQDAARAEISFEVITGAEAVERVIAMVNAAGQRTKPLDASLQAALKSLEKGHVGPAINQLEAFQQQALAQVARDNPALARQLIAAAQAIMGALHDAP